MRELTRNQKTDAALRNEQITRQRVERLEAVQGFHKHDINVHALQIDRAAEMLWRRGFWGRMSWLLFGR